MKTQRRRLLGMMLVLMALVAIWIAPSRVFAQDAAPNGDRDPRDTLTNHYYTQMNAMRKDPVALQCVVWRYQTLMMHPPETRTHSNYYEPCWKPHLARKSQPGYREIQNPPPVDMMRAENWNAIPRYNAEVKRVFNVVDTPDPVPPAPPPPAKRNPTLRERAADPLNADIASLEASECITNMALGNRCVTTPPTSAKPSQAKPERAPAAPRVAAAVEPAPKPAAKPAVPPTRPATVVASASKPAPAVDSNPYTAPSGMDGWQIISATSEKLEARALAGADLRVLRRLYGKKYDFDDTNALVRSAEFRDFDVGYRSDGKTMYEPLASSRAIVWDPIRHSPREALKRDLKGPPNTEFLDSAKGPIYLVPQPGQAITIAAKGVEAPPPPKAAVSTDVVATNPGTVPATTVTGPPPQPEVAPPPTAVSTAETPSVPAPNAGSDRTVPVTRRVASGKRQQPPLLFSYCIQGQNRRKGICSRLDYSEYDRAKSDDARKAPHAKPVSSVSGAGKTGPPQ